MLVCSTRLGHCYCTHAPSTPAKDCPLCILVLFKHQVTGQVLHATAWQGSAQKQGIVDLPWQALQLWLPQAWAGPELMLVWPLS